MAYNFPVNYQYFPMPQNAVPQPQVQPQMPVQQQQNGIIWVQGEAGAKSYLVAPNTTVQLWDSEAQTIYLKSADASGMPTMKILDYTIRDQGGQTAPSVIQDHADYVTRDEFSALADRVEKLIERKSKGGKQDE